MIYRHGDVILKQISELPANFQILEHDRSCVLATGEATGHQHTLTSPVNLFLVETENHQRFVKLDAPGRLYHQEHNRIDVSVGIYEILKEREFDFLEHASVPVFD